ncbi:MAG: addiction module protein [Gammaproteobacteria bacterium]
MAQSVQEIEQKVRSLRTEERNQLLRDLIADVDGESEHDVERAWLQEAKQRHQQLLDRVTTPVPAAQAIKNARSRLKSEG